MSDDIFDYFGGGGTREVEPIEDDDSGEYQQGLGQEQPTAEQVQGTETGEEAPPATAPADDDIFAAFSGNTRSSDSQAQQPTSSSRSQPDSDSPSTPSSASREGRAKAKRPEKDAAKVAKPTAEIAPKEEKPAKKSGGNWDFLANVLGLSGSKQAKSAQVPSDGQEDSAVAEVAEADTQRDNQSKKDKVSTSPQSSNEKAPAAQKRNESTGESTDEAPGEFFGFNFDSADPTKITPVGKPARSAKREPVAESTAAAPSQKSASADPDDGSGLSDDDDIFSAFAAPASKSQRAQTDRSDEESNDQSDAAEVDLSGHDIVADDDFVEFEIEELDNSEIDPKAEAARGRRRRNRNSRGRGADATNGESETVDQPPRQNTRGGRRSGKSGNNEGAPPRSQNEGRSRRNRSARKESFELDSPSNKQRPSRYDQSDSADGSENVQDDFGTGILEDIDPRDIDPRNGGVDSPDQDRGARGGRGRKRRSRGGRGKNRSRDEATTEFAKGLKSDDADDRWNNPEPELGWDDQFEASDSNDSDSDGDFESDSSPRQQRSSGRRRSQGGRGRGRSNRSGRPQFADDDQEVVSRSKHENDDSWSDNFDDDGDRDSDQSETQSNERSGRRKRRSARDRADSDQGTSRSARPSGDRDHGDRDRDDRDDRDRGARSRRGRRRPAEDDVPSVPRYGDVPTWDDTISSVISQNMKSNGRSGGRGRGGRGRSGGSHGGSGGNDRSRNARSGSDRNRGSGQDSNGRNGSRRNRR